MAVAVGDACWIFIVGVAVALAACGTWLLVGVAVMVLLGVNVMVIVHVFVGVTVYVSVELGQI